MKRSTRNILVVLVALVAGAALWYGPVWYEERLVHQVALSRVEYFPDPIPENNNTEGGETGSPTNSTNTPEPEQPVAGTNVPASPPSTSPSAPASPPSTSIPKTVFISVPFLAQAPFGDWADPRQQDGCEEASLSMAAHWVNGTSVSKEQGLKEILDAFAWQEKNLGGDPSLSIADTVRVGEGYFGLATLSVRNNVATKDIKNELAAGNIVIAPVDGRALGNPYFTPPGPLEHMLVIVGYDDTKGVFITNDPGTRQGKSFTYSYGRMIGALREYPTGHLEPIAEIKKNVIVVSRPS